MMKPTITPTWDELDNDRNAWFLPVRPSQPGVTIDQAAALDEGANRPAPGRTEGAPLRKFPEDKERYLNQNFSLIPASGGQSRFVAV